MPPRRPTLDSLLAKARALPKSPGVYLMKDAQGRVLYVGKTLKLADRVSSYFLPSTNLGLKKQPLLQLVADFDTIDCEGEWEALLAENRLIKDLHPKFNVSLTDDKTYPYLVITLRDDFPAVYITRQPADPRYKGAKILGPFTSVYALRQSIHFLQKVFKFRTCELEIHEPREPQINREPETTEPLSLRSTQPTQSQIRNQKSVTQDSGLSTLDSSPTTDHRPLTTLSDPRRFFRPCLLYPIKQCTAPCAAKISKAHYRADADRFIRCLESKRSVLIRELQAEMTAASQSRQYEQAAALRDQIHALNQLDQRGSFKDRWQPETESFVSDPRKALQSLQKTLGLDSPIRCVECIDVAHLQGRETVGSKVCFVDGRPLRNQYRRYRVKSAKNDDYAAIREVVSRRYRDAGSGNELYPDLIIIDGGLGQLHAAQQAFDQLQIKPPMVVSLAKKEELLYAQSRSEPIRLPRSNPGLKLCQSIRDEAHRFAQHYHHILRKKKSLLNAASKQRTPPKPRNPHNKK